MSLINIPGMTEDSLTNLDTAATGGGFRPFPCDAYGWTQQTGVVVKAGIKVLTFDGVPSENISIEVANAPYGAEILINLDVKRVPPGTKDPAKMVQENLDTLTKVIKILGAHTNGKLDTAKLEKAHGQCVAFICKHKGFKTKNGKSYHNISYIFKGQVPDILDVVMAQMPEVPGSTAPASPSSSDYDPFGA